MLFVGLAVILENVCQSVEAIVCVLLTVVEILIDVCLTVIIVRALYLAVDKNTHYHEQFIHEII